MQVAQIDRLWQQAMAARRPRGLVHRIVLAVVWLAVASGAVVFSEPAPVDVLTMALIVGLPAAGLIALPRAILLSFAFCLIAAAAAFLASAQAMELDVAIKHSAISLYLYFSVLVFAGFVALRPTQHTELVLRAYTWGALIAALAGLAGYFGLLPGAAELFTKYGRAAGPFKDPNVFGPFLVPALLYSFHKIFTGGRRGVWPIACIGILSLAVLVSFSRGAWANAFVATAIYVVMTFIVSRSNRQRVGLLLLVMGAIGVVVVLLSAALQSDKVANLMRERASLIQSYDVGPNGRFGGQAKAIDLIATHPLGIGALQFAGRFHNEEVHNVYLSMFLNAGWVGGLAFIGIVMLTMLFGIRQAFRRSPIQPLLIIVVAAFCGNAIEGMIVDIDHWRHFYLLMGLCWGLSSTQWAPQRCEATSRCRRLVAMPTRARRIAVAKLRHAYWSVPIVERIAPTLRPARIVTA